MSKLPAILFYPADWLKDDVAGCSLSAQGLWLRMMIVMHSCEPYGYLAMNGASIPSESVARRCGCTPDEYATLLDELERAGVPSRNADGIIYSRRMVKDASIRSERAKAGRKGGKRSGISRSKIEAKPQAKTKQKPAIVNEVEVPEDLKAFASDIGHWLRYKQEKGQAYKPAGLASLWARCRELGKQLPESVQISMANNWAGLFAPRSPCARQDAAFGVQRGRGSKEMNDLGMDEVQA